MKGKIGAVLLALVMIFGLIGAVICLERVPAGYPHEEGHYIFHRH